MKYHTEFRGIPRGRKFKLLIYSLLYTTPVAVQQGTNQI